MHKEELHSLRFQNQPMSNNNTAIVTRIIPTELTINGQPYHTNMYGADIRDPLLLGLDFLHRFCCNIDPREITLRIGDNVVAGTLKTNTYNDDIPVSQVLVARNTFVPANTIENNSSSRETA